MLPIDLSGKRAFIAGVADDGGFGFAIAKALAEAGATVCVGTWPPALGIFVKMLERGKMDESIALATAASSSSSGSTRSTPPTTRIEDVPAEVLREQALPGRWATSPSTGLAASAQARFRRPGPRHRGPHRSPTAPRCKKPLIDTSRDGYLAAISVSAYSNVSLVRAPRPDDAPRRRRSSRSPTWRASASCRAMAAACPRPRRRSRPTRAPSRSRRAAAGACASTRSPPARSRRARPRAIGFIDTMIELLRGQRAPPAHASRPPTSAPRRRSSRARWPRRITGSTVYVDNGYHAMGMAVSSIKARYRAARASLRDGPPA